MKCPYCEGSGDLSGEGLHVGAMILATRRKLKMTQEELAKAISMSRAQIANLEGGRGDPSLKTLGKIATAFDCSVRELIPE